ncbi:hypothetical protein RHAL1_P00072 (plasmid) [Beijerinckiaceae bacterium RH AL1]|nr:hypothetical protein [Beijerinckiaceae bacterium]VVC57326.1 hypothetical protein RHAL1_P00072 [Beijerinckiaceae bacterium RH AL1]
MKLYSIIRHVLAACLIAGLFLAPLTAARSAQASTSAMMMDGMDCCPKVPAHTNCPKCPLMALCMSDYAVEKDAHTVGVKLTAAVVRNLLPASEPMPTGLGSAPPSRPPRVQA